MSNLYNVVGSVSYANLLADPQGADAIAIPVEPGNGDIPAGTLMYRKTSGFWAPAASGQATTSYLLAVLKEAVASGAAGTIVAEDAVAYRSGIFVDGAVKLASAADLSADNKTALAKQGIFFDKKDAAANTFDNGGYAITYNPNNGLTGDSAEAPVTDYKLAGTAYTILNNSDSKLGFTAPATKSFSKWNTKADGSGTDYAAAASYNTDADLILYAVWA